MFQYEICVDSVHEILQRIKDGEAIGRREGKTTALLYYAIEMLIDHPDLNIIFYSHGDYSFIKDMVANICSEPNLDCAVENVRHKTGMIINEKGFISCRVMNQQMKKVSTYIHDMGRQDLTIYDVNDPHHQVLKYNGYDQNIIDDVWFIPKEYYGPEMKFEMVNENTESIVNKWGRINA